MECPTIVAEKLAKTKLAIAVLDHHIEILEAILSYLIRSQDQPNDLSLAEYEKKIATVKKEIEFAVRQRHKLMHINEMGIEYRDGNFLLDI
jgi:hypothetical protein